MYFKVISVCVSMYLPNFGPTDFGGCYSSDPHMCGGGDWDILVPHSLGGVALLPHGRWDLAYLVGLIILKILK